MIWPSEAPLDMHRKYSLFAHGFKKALTDEEKAEQDARLAAEAQIAVERSRKAVRSPCQIICSPLNQRMMRILVMRHLRQIVRLLMRVPIHMLRRRRVLQMTSRRVSCW